MKYTPLQRLLIVVDKILNPKATTLPFYYTEKINGHFYYKKPERCIVVRRFVENDTIHIWVIRWLQYGRN